MSNESANTELTVKITSFLRHKKGSEQFLIHCQAQSFDSLSSDKCKFRCQSEEDIESYSHWINLSKGCNWWVDSRCVGIHYKNSGAGEKSLDKGAKHHYFFHKHIPRAELVGWDAQKEEKILQEKKRESSKTLANEIKKIEIKKC